MSERAPSAAVAAVVAPAGSVDVPILQSGTRPPRLRRAADPIEPQQHGGTVS